MARSRTIKKTRKSKKQNSTRFLPDSIQAFIARRIVDSIALCFALCAGFLFAALLSYSSHDPSWNTSAQVTTMPEIHNIAGVNGAWAADILFQFFGLAAFILPVTCMLLAHRVYRRKQVRPLYLRAFAILCATLSTAVAISSASSLSIWDSVNSGGSIGLLLGEIITTMLQSLSVPFASAIMSFLVGIVAFISFAYGSALSRHELASFGLRAQYACVQCALSVMRFGEGIAAWIARYNDPDNTIDTEKVSLTSRLTGKLNDIKEKAADNAKDKNVSDKIVIAKAEQSISSSTKKKPIEHEVENEEQSPIENIPVVKPLSSDKSKSKTDKDTGQQRFALNTVDGEWELPSASLIQDIPDHVNVGTLNEDALRRNAELLRSVLEDFNIKGEIVSIHPGPVVTLYELEPAPGTKTSRVISLSDDIARSMSAISVRCAVVPGRNVIGIELPNKTRQTVYMKEMLQSRLYDKTSAKLPLILGKDIGGQPILADLAKMPHLLVAGTTGSGKSVAVNTMIMSLLYRLSPEQCRFIMIDPKMLELSVYDDIPHLLSPVVTEPGKAIVALKWAVHEMEERYRNMSKLGVRNVEGYNQRIREAIKNGEEIMHKVQTGFDPETGKATFEDRPLPLNELPYIVIIVDEFADLMLVAGKDVENAIQRLAQMARAAGLHLIMATQRPSVDVITGVVKANFPTRISFQVTSKIDSRTILGDAGAEQLLGMGDMLYMAPGGRITRVHGPFVSDDDVEKTTNFLRAQATPSYIDDVTSEDADFGGSEVMNAMFGEGGGSDGEKVDDLYDKAVAIITREGKVSTSFVQRHLQIGYNRAARIVEEMERQGIISPANATGKRQILVSDHSGA